jgi:hypothetical protein
MGPVRRAPGRLRALLVGLAVLLPASSSLADSRSELRSRIVYSVPATCPTETRFLELLAQHSDVVIDGTAPIALSVAVKAERGRHRGRVALVAAKEEGVREVVADRCEDVVRGLALFSAIALDAYFEHRTKEEEALPPAPPPPVVEMPASEMPASLPARNESAPATAPAPESAPRRPPLRVRYGLGAGQQGATATRLLHYVGAFGEIELTRTLRTSIRLSSDFGAVLPQTYGDGTLAFGMGWLRLEVCPAWARLARTLLASICPQGDAGIQGASLDGPRGRSEIRPWLAAGGVARLRTDLGRTVALEAAAGAIAPLLPLDFRTRTGVVYSTPGIVPVVELDLVVSVF